MEDNYKKLNEDFIEHEITILSKRIGERFPESGLYKISKQLIIVIDEAKNRSQEFSKPNYYLRSLSFFLIGMIAVAIFYMFSQFDFHIEKLSLFNLFSVIEAGVNDLVFISIMIFFISSLETKIKRKKALRAMDELRSLAHVIDMHQLNKDPQLLVYGGPSTESSPKRTYTIFEMGRYLNYCSEMLSLIAKISAYYIQNLNDQIVLNTANEIEALTSGISNKVWEKSMILHMARPVETKQK